jgi:nickel/cobalt exporter
MRRLLLFFVAAAALVSPTAASAHPLGNFTVNRYSGIELSGERIYVHYVLDIAEIPTFQEGDTVRAPGFVERVGRRLELRVDGHRVPLGAVQHKLGERPGAGGLPVLRFEAVFAAEGELARAGRVARLVFQDTNFASRVGWKEVVVTAEHGARIETSTAPAKSVSDALRAYPKELLKAPLEVTSATVRFEPGSADGTPPSLSSAPPPEREAGGFEALVSTEDLGLGVILVSLALAAFWGAAHALTPGHGKAIVAGYLVGSRGKPRHALLLGVIVTVTHTIGVFALGLVTLLLSRYVVPERLYPWLTVVSGLLVVVVGASVLGARLKRRGTHGRGFDHHRHEHPHGHHDHAHGQHDHGHHHDHTTRGLLGVGVAAGLLPCPSALVVLLSAIALHRVGFGLALIVAFSVGLAATISSIGLLAVLARRAFSRLRFDGPLVRTLPAVSAFLIVAVGIGITAKALPEVI